MGDNNDYTNGYRDGWRDGYQEGKNEASKIPTPNPYHPPPLSVKSHCPLCGMKLENAMGYVCYSPGCPTFPQFTSGGK